MSQDRNSISTVVVPFLASMLGRPIVMYHANPGIGCPSVFETNMMTGEKMTGEPIRIYVNYGHYEAVLKMD